MFLSSLNLPEDLKNLSCNEKNQLCEEIRSFLINTVSQTGGHLSSSLGTVELSVALHSVFDSPKDKIVWDVGHQAYTHKILTGRYNEFDTLRKENGISGFPRPSESKHDAFIGGHSSISISAAIGIATAVKLKGLDNKTIAVIGDGAFTGGIAYEGLNNAGKCDGDLIIVLNENQMSISKNVGALARHLVSIRTSLGYYKTKRAVKRTFENTPVLGDTLNKVAHTAKSIFKQAIYHSNIFEEFGLEYIGPIDGHNMEELLNALEMAKKLNRPSLVHVYTVKGKGFQPAEDNPGAFHGVSLSSLKQVNDTFSDVFGKELTMLAENDKKICAITAAMKYGTGLQYFYKRHKNRFFDVGIAEQHAVTFACGLASEGLIPVFAVYSTFLQRSVDQIINDSAIEKYHIVLAVDRAGLVGEDGETHQGVFDVSILSSIPNVTIYSPADYKQLKYTLSQAVYKTDGVVAIRYPRGYEAQGNVSIYNDVNYSDYKYFYTNADILTISYGRLCSTLYEIYDENKEKFDIIGINKISPLPIQIINICQKYKKILFFEEGVINGGIGQKLLYEIQKAGYKGDYEIIGIPDEFVKQAKITRQLEIYKLDKKSVFEKIKSLI